MSKLGSLALVFLLAAACNKKSDGESGGAPGSEESGGAPAAGESGGAAGGHAELAQLVNQAASALVQAGRQGTIDPRWGIAADDPSLAEAKSALAAVPEAKLGITVIELEAVKPDGYLRTGLAVFPDGRVRWVNLQHRGSASVSPTDGLAQASPVLAAAVDQLVARLSGPECESLPLMTAEDISDFPAEAKQQFRDPSPQLSQVCAAMKGAGQGWQPRVDDLTVVLIGGDRAAAIRSSFEVEGGKLHLDPPRVRLQ